MIEVLLSLVGLILLCILQVLQDVRDERQLGPARKVTLLAVCERGREVKQPIIFYLPSIEELTQDGNISTLPHYGSYHRFFHRN